LQKGKKMFDPFNREITYLRISVTDRCNLRCRYCMPEDGINLKNHSDILSFEEITDFAEEAVRLGINKVRITGGEPLVRKNIEILIKSLSEINGITDLAMTTNGILLEEFAQKLKSSGLMRLNISLDSLDPEKYKYITRGGDLNKVISGIYKAKETGFTKIKLNTVLDKNTSGKEIDQIKIFASENNLENQFIKKMDLKTGQFWVVSEGHGGDCSNCNRIRLTSDGFVRPCLFSDKQFNIRELGFKEAILSAVNVKPQKGQKSINGNFYSIGG